jgi:hypothetical protein
VRPKSFLASSPSAKAIYPPNVSSDAVSVSSRLLSVLDAYAEGRTAYTLSELYSD